MGKEESTQFIVKNIGFDDFKEYVEQDFIEKLSPRGILFLNDKYSSKALLKIKSPKKVTNQLDIADLGNKFKGGYVNKLEILSSIICSPTKN